MEENVQLDEGFEKEQNQSWNIPYLKRYFFHAHDRPCRNLFSIPKRIKAFIYDPTVIGRFHIAYAMYAMIRFKTAPRQGHLKAVKRVLAY
jgi:hypothetical protein